MSRAGFVGAAVFFAACAVVNVVQWGPLSGFLVPADLAALAYCAWSAWESP